MNDAVRRARLAGRARAVRFARARRCARAAWLAAVAAVSCALVLPALAAHAADLNAINHAIAAGASGVASGVGAGTAVPSLGIGALLQTVFGLAVVVALVFACAWLARRFGLAPAVRGSVVRTVGGVSLGGKERVAVVEIGDTWLVLGAAPGNVRLLHTLPAGSAHASAAMGGQHNPGSPEQRNSADATFGSRFRAALVDETKKRFSRSPGGDQ
jgi:flagellar protein FliO/FliZ